MNKHLPRCVVIWTARFALLGVLLLFSSQEQLLSPVLPVVPPPSLAPPDKAMEIVVMVQPGPTTYFRGPDGEPTGFDVDLLRQFAAHKKMPLHFVVADQSAQLLHEIAVGTAHIGAGGLYRPASSEAEPVATDITLGISNAIAHSSPAARTGDPLWTMSYYALSPALIYNSAGYKRSQSDDLANYYERAFTLGGRCDLAWAVGPQYPALRDELDAFLQKLKRNGTLQRLADRHFAPVAQLPRVDAEALQERIHSVLPQFRAMLQDAQHATGIEWRLLAAIAYQESQWDPLATSETGVRGLMQITEETARHLGVVDRLDAKTSIMAAARYLHHLKQKMPARIREPDRTWFALAAFNIGIAHLEDARILAQRQKLNPDAWNDVKGVLPLLADPEYHSDAKYGYARGGMPVAFVDRVRAYYDILLVQQPALSPRLQTASMVTEGSETPVVEAE